jgi:hypothetical protein
VPYIADTHEATAVEKPSNERILSAIFDFIVVTYLGVVIYYDAQIYQKVARVAKKMHPKAHFFVLILLFAEF